MRRFLAWLVWTPEGKALLYAVCRFVAAVLVTVVLAVVAG